MKKLISIATCLAAVSGYALPTYEPFTEYATQVTASGTNSIDLASGGYQVTTGATVENWTSWKYSGVGTDAGKQTAVGLDIQVTNFTASVFTSNNLSSILPTNFPGFPSPTSPIDLVAFLPYNTGNTNNSIGNSAVLNFSQDMVRPASGTKTIFVSYLLDVPAAGSAGTGNNGRFTFLVPSTNLVEGAGTSGAYTTPEAYFTTFYPTGPNYVSYGVKTGYPGSGEYLLPSDSAGGNYPGPQVAGVGTVYNTAAFVVSAYVMTTGGTGYSLKDTNMIWVNPSTSLFGGPNSTALAAFPYKYTMTNIDMSDVGGFVLGDRIGGGWSGGWGGGYIGNLIVGDTWSYVTGGPEFTNQLTNGAVVLSPGATQTLGPVAAIAAGQSVTYQWQLNGVNINNGPNGTGGGATVTGANSAALTLSGVNAQDAGNYTAVATASGTGLTLSSTNSLLIVSDPAVVVQPSAASVNAGGTATYTATVETTSSKLTYAWYYGSTMLTSGLQADGSFAMNAQGTNGTGQVVLTLTLTNVTCQDAASSYTLYFTNLTGSTASTTPTTLTVVDPYITVQPAAAAEAGVGGSTTFGITANGTALTYQWSWINGNGNNVNNGEISGVTSPTLTITGATASDDGTYSVTVTGNGSCSGAQVTSSSTVVYIDTAAPTSASVSPANYVQQIGTHLALVGNASGAAGLVNFVWTHNGTNLSNGLQADGSYVFGQNAQLIPNLPSPLILSNLQIGDSGTYALIASNAAGNVSASSVVQVVGVGQLKLNSNNLVVIRVGDGAQTLSGSTGNTLYLDQFTTSGTYSNTIMVPDTGSNALIVAGASIATGNEGAQEGYLTLSSNSQFLNFGGFCYSYPYINGVGDVTVGQQEPGGSVTNVRGIYALDAFGTMALVYTNYGLYSAGHGFRDVYSTDGLTNFWTTGSASAGTVKYVNAGPAGAAYTITSPGSGVPALGAAASGGVSLGLYEGNLIFSDNSTDGDANTGSVWGLDSFVGTPMAATTASTQFLPGGIAHADDFAFSPDFMTVYVADDDSQPASANGGSGGGIQRWDNVGGTWTFANYFITDTTGIGTNGFRGLAVYWPPSITSWGAGVGGAVLYGTTSETVGNRIVQIADSGNGSVTETVLATAAANQFYRGIRFAPITVPVSETASSSASTAEVGQSVDFSANVSGVFSYYYPNWMGGYNLLSPIPTTYQWNFDGVAIPGATNYLYTLTNTQATNAGTYTFVVSNATGVATIVPLPLTVNAFSTSANLVGWFKFNDGSGLNAADSSPYNDTGALQNFPGDNSEWVTGLGGADALNFANTDANNDNVVVVPDEPQLNFTNSPAFTIAAWINVASNSTVASSGALVSKGYGNGGEQYDLDIFNGEFRIFVRSAAGTYYGIISSNTEPFNTWVHVAAAYDGYGGTLSLYTNGQLYSTIAAPSSLLYTTLPLAIGNRTASSTSAYNLPFYGEIQDVRIYDVALGQSDISAIESILAPPVTPTPVQYISPAVTGGPGAPTLHFKGTAGGSYRIWTTTNVALTPVETKWTLIYTGTFTGNIDTFAAPAGSAAQFYTITQP